MSVVVSPPCPPAPPASQSIQRGVALAMATLYILWSSTYLALRVAVVSLPPFLMAGTRFLIAGALLYAWLRYRGEPNPTRRQWIHAGVLGIFLLICGNGFVSYAVQFVPSGTTAILVASSSIWTTLFGIFVGLRPRALEWAGIAVGMAGIAVLQWPALAGAATHAPGYGIGIALILGGAALWGVGSILALRLDLPSSGMATAVEMLIAGAIMAAGAPLLGERIPHTATLSALVAFGYLVAVAVAGFTAFNYALRHARPALASSYVYVNPILAVFLGAVILDEPVTGRTVAALVFVIAGVLLTIFSKVRRSP